MLKGEVMNADRLASMPPVVGTITMGKGDIVKTIVHIIQGVYNILILHGCTPVQATGENDNGKTS